MSRIDHGSHTEHDAGIADRLTVVAFDERDWDEPSEVCEFEHSHGPGLLCLVCALDAAIQKRDEAELAVCDVCNGLYDEGCIHDRHLCEQCLGACYHCCEDRRADWDGGRE